VNAGCYVFRRSVIDAIPAGRPVSVERETFPALLAEERLVLGYVEDAYWLDLGTPEAFVRGSCDLVRGLVSSPALPGPVGESLVLADATVASDAVLCGGTTIGARAKVGSGAVIAGSVVLDDAVIGAGCRVTGSCIGRGANVGTSSVLESAVIGDGASIGARNELLHGIRVWPDAVIPDGSVRFSTDG
jgi:mannose-1-phosphate guanylyltransferase